jgi:hypothetical protein
MAITKVYFPGLCDGANQTPGSAFLAVVDQGGGIVKLDVSGGGGGSSSPGLPVWTFQAGGGIPSNFNFTTDNAAAGNTTSITLSNNSQNLSGADWTTFFFGGSVQNFLNMVLVDSVGKPNVLLITAVSIDGNGNIQCMVTPTVYPAAYNWSGDYQFSFSPTPVVPQLSAVLAASGITTFAQFLSTFGITPVLDGTVTPVTSITTDGGIPTAIS